MVANSVYVVKVWGKYVMQFTPAFITLDFEKALDYYSNFIFKLRNYHPELQVISEKKDSLTGYIGNDFFGIKLQSYPLNKELI